MLQDLQQVKEIAMIPLLISAITVTMCQFPAFFYPTIDGAREELPYIQAEIPYLLGISVPPPSVIDITVMQGIEQIYSGQAMGTFDIMQITSLIPVLFYEDGVYVGQVVPEPASIFMIYVCGTYLRHKHNKRMCRRNRKT